MPARSLEDNCDGHKHARAKGASITGKEPNGVEPSSLDRDARSPLTKLSPVGRRVPSMDDV